jgi:hypothetical protein
LPGAVFLPDELDQEEVEDEDEESQTEPEDGGQAAELIAVPMEGDHVVLVSRSYGGRNVFVRSRNTLFNGLMPLTYVQAPGLQQHSDQKSKVPP